MVSFTLSKLLVKSLVLVHSFFNSDKAFCNEGYNGVTTASNGLLAALNNGAQSINRLPNRESPPSRPNLSFNDLPYFS